MDPNKFTIISTANYKTMPTIPSSILCILTWLLSQPTLSHLNSIGSDLLLQSSKGHRQQNKHHRYTKQITVSDYLNVPQHLFKLWKLSA
jgi:hypothetical protein